MGSFEVDASALNTLAVELVSSTTTLGAQASAALRKTAFDIQGAAQAKAPVDTGTLRASISTTFTGDGRTGAMEAEIGPTVEHGGFVEEGTSRQAPQPYLGPAFDEHSPKLVAAFEQLSREVLP